MPESPLDLPPSPAVPPRRVFPRWMVGVLVLIVALWGGWILTSTVKWNSAPGMNMSGGAAMPGMTPPSGGTRR